MFPRLLFLPNFLYFKKSVVKKLCVFSVRHDSTSSLIRYIYGAFLCWDRPSTSMLKKIQKWRKSATLSFVSFPSEYSLQTSQVSNMMINWLWHSRIVVSLAEDYVWWSFWTNSVVFSSATTCLVLAASLEKYDLICCGVRNSSMLNLCFPLPCQFLRFERRVQSVMDQL